MSWCGLRLGAAGVLAALPRPLPASGLRLDAVVAGEPTDVGVRERRVFGHVGWPLARSKRGQRGSNYFLSRLLVRLFCLAVPLRALVEACQRARFVGHGNRVPEHGCDTYAHELLS